jgi:hypothetical protein
MYADEISKTLFSSGSLDENIYVWDFTRPPDPLLT